MLIGICHTPTDVWTPGNMVWQIQIEREDKVPRPWIYCLANFVIQDHLSPRRENCCLADSDMV